MSVASASPPSSAAAPSSDGDLDDPPVASRAPMLLGLLAGLVASALLLDAVPLGVLLFVPLGMAVGGARVVLRQAALDRDHLRVRMALMVDRIDGLEREVRVLGHRLEAGASMQPMAGAAPVAAARADDPAAVPAAALRDGRPASTASVPVRRPGVEPRVSATPGALAPVASAADAVAAREAAGAMTPVAASATASPVRAPSVARAAGPPAPPPPPSALERLVGAARAWLFGGNTVARVGLLVLFLGVAFLLRYVAEHTQVPVELRLAGIAAAGLAMLLVGWRMRSRRPGFAITLQGGGFGVLYLTVFAALRLYDVLPVGAAFVAMAVLAGGAAVLAVAQDARALMVLGSVGGYLAPVLISTGGGRVAGLFAWYAVLNCGVLAVATVRAWRELNWIGFVFTFGVSGLWAVQRYRPDDFLVGQGFLALFWSMFLAVSVLFALRSAARPPVPGTLGDHDLLGAAPPPVRRPVPATGPGRFDTTLAFALPLAAFGIQSRFTSGLALALAATVAAAVYLGVAALLLARAAPRHRLFADAHFVLGVGFLTLAVPLAASAQWTAAAWAVEGVALVWVATRQQRALPLVAGLLLHLMGAVMLLDGLAGGTPAYVAGFNGLTVNLVVFAAAAFATAALARRGIGGAGAWPLVALASRGVGWVWSAVAIGQALPFPGFLAGWCVLAFVLAGLAGRSAPRAGGATSPLDARALDGAAAIVLVGVAAAVAFFADLPELDAPRWSLAGFDAAGWLATMRLLIAVTAAAGALVSLRGHVPVDAADEAIGGAAAVDGTFQEPGALTPRLRRLLAGVLLSLGVLTWLGGLGHEAVQRIGAPHALLQALLVLAVLTALGLMQAGERLRWRLALRWSWLQFAATLLLGAAALAVAVLDAHPAGSGWGLLVWPLGALLYAWRLARDDGVRGAPLMLRAPLPAVLHAGGALLAVAMLAAEAALRVDALAPRGAWFHAAWGAVPALALFALVRAGWRWPMASAADTWRGVVAPALAAGLAAWLLWSSVDSDGTARPLPWLPLLNPLDLASLLAVLAAAAWSRGVLGEDPARLGGRRALVAAAGFVALNLATLRAVHHLAGVPWALDALAASRLVQATLSLLWAITAMVLMVGGHRRALRRPWVIGAGLLAVVVLKLLVVDLSGRGTIERIVSFLGVGGLLLLIGFLAPVPPAAAARPEDEGGGAGPQPPGSGRGQGGRRDAPLARATGAAR